MHERRNKTKQFEIFLGDLNQECQKRLLEFLDGDNGNYDVFPLATLDYEDTEMEDNVE